MNGDRPTERLVRTLARKQLDQSLDLLESLDCAMDLQPGERLDVANASQHFALRLEITRLSVQAVLSGFTRATSSSASGPLGGADADAGDEQLKDIHRAILAKATAAPQTARQLIQAAHYKFNSNSRAAITLLVKLGKLQRVGQGDYRLPPAA